MVSRRSAWRSCSTAAIRAAVSASMRERAAASFSAMVFISWARTENSGWPASTMGPPKSSAPMRRAFAISAFMGRSTQRRLAP